MWNSDGIRQNDKQKKTTKKIMEKMYAYSKDLVRVNHKNFATCDSF